MFIETLLLPEILDLYFSVVYTTAAVSSKSPNTYSMSYHKHYNLSSVAAMAKQSRFRGGSDTGQETMEYFLPQTLLHGKIQWIQRRF